MAQTIHVKRQPSQSSNLKSAGTGSTVIEGHEFTRPKDETVQHAMIIDIDAQKANPLEGLAVLRPPVQDLLESGPAKLMNGVKSHGVTVRWIHLRANCMAWVDQVMERICEERHIPLVESGNDGSKSNPLLRSDMWEQSFSGKLSGQVHSRCMIPSCTPFAINVEDEASDSNGSTKRSRDNMTLFLQYLHWETDSAWQERKELIRAVTEKDTGIGSTSDIDLVKEYLHHDTGPLHDRRALHQAFYHNVGTFSELQNHEQVMQEFTSSDKKRHPAKLIVVDQLWLWIIKGSPATEDGPGQPDIVVTAFPDRFNEAYDSSSVVNNIIGTLERGIHPPLRHANHLVAAIVDHCTGVFFERQIGEDRWFLEFFASRTGKIKNDQRLACDKFRSACDTLQKLQDNKASLTRVSTQLEDRAFGIDEESKLSTEIKEVIDDLGCIDYLLRQQEKVTNSLSRAQRSKCFELVSETVRDRRAAWASIADEARVVEGSIMHQMDMKQKQANLSESRFSRYQVEESARTGRVILLFTIVTIIFLPLSFLAGWFGMNVKDGNAGNLSLLQISAVIFPISIIITLFTIVVAFRDKLQTILSGVRIKFRREIEPEGTPKSMPRRRSGDVEMWPYGTRRRLEERQNITLGHRD